MAKMAEKKSNRKKVGVVALSKSFFKQFGENSSSMLSNGMVYSTLIAVVPCFAVIYAVLNLFGVLDPVMEVLQNYVIGTFGESTGASLVSYLSVFTENAVGMGIVSMLSFAVTFVLLIDQIFTVVNKIYNTQKGGNPIIRYLKYVGIIVVGLLAIVLAVFLIGRFNSVAVKLRGFPQLSTFQKLLKTIIPIGAIFGIMLAVIILIPNCNVNFRSGLIGAIFGTVGIMVLGFVFSFVVGRSVKYSVIYGSLATLMFSFMFLSYLWKIIFASVTLAYVHQRETVGFKASK